MVCFLTGSGSHEHGLDYRISQRVDLRSNAHREHAAVGSNGFHRQQCAWNESQLGQVAQQVRVVIAHSLHDDRHAWRDCREWLTGRSDDMTSPDPGWGPHEGPG